MRTESSVIIGRLVKVERSLKIWKIFSIFPCFILIVLIFMGLKPAEMKTLEAERILLRDENGQIRLLLGSYPFSKEDKEKSENHLFAGASEEEGYGLRVFGETGYEIIRLVHRKGEKENEGYSYLRLNDPSDMNNRVSLKAQKGYSTIDLSSAQYPEEEHTAFWKKYNSLKGKALAEFRDNVPAGKDFSLQLSVGSAYGGGISVTRNSFRHVDMPHSRGSLNLRLMPNGESFLSLAAPKDNDQMILGATTLVNSKTGVEEHRPNSSLVFFDAKGTALQKLP